MTREHYSELTQQPAVFLSTMQHNR